MKTFTFRNVIVSIEAETAQDAYNKLCSLLIPNDDGAVEYTTDTYVYLEDDGSEVEKNTKKLFG